MSVPSNLGHVHRKRSHPVHIGHDLTRTEDCSQLTSDRLLQCQQRHGTALGCDAHLHHLHVVGDHPLGQGQVGAQQGLGCWVDRRRGRPHIWPICSLSAANFS